MKSNKVVGLTAAMIAVVMMMMILNTSSATTDIKKAHLCSLRGGSWAAQVANVDWLMTSTAYTVIVDLPGAENLDIVVKEKYFEIWIDAERMRPTEDDNEIYFIGRTHGLFWRRFCFPEDAIMGDVQAHLHNGVLSLTIPRNQSVSAYVPPPHMFDGIGGPRQCKGIGWCDL